MAKPDNGEAKGHVNKPAKKAKSKAGVSGGGVTELGEFSAQARAKHQPKGHFNYTSTDGTLQLRCRSFSFVTVEGAPANSRTVDFGNCATISGTEPTEVRQPVVGTVRVVFTDNGQPSEVVGAPKDHISFTFGGVDHSRDLTGGNIKIR